MNDYDGEWYPTDDGATIETRGPEGGLILRDEELGDPDEPEDADARLTLEQGRADNPGFFVSANLYGGWMFVVARRDSRADADILYEALRPELVRLATMLPREGDRNLADKVAALNAAAAEIESRFGEK